MFKEGTFESKIKKFYNT